MAKALKNFILGFDSYVVGDDVPDDVASWVRADLVDEKPLEAPVGAQNDDNEDAPGDEDADASEEDLESYEDLTNDELRTELENRGLDTDGKKAILIARLEADDESE